MRHNRSGIPWLYYNFFYLSSNKLASIYLYIEYIPHGLPFRPNELTQMNEAPTGPATAWIQSSSQKRGLLSCCNRKKELRRLAAGESATVPEFLATLSRPAAVGNSQSPPESPPWLSSPLASWCPWQSRLNPGPICRMVHCTRSSVGCHA